MAREASITFEQVAAAAEEIKNNGGRPNSRTVREILGMGSITTILKHLQAWGGTEVKQNQARNVSDVSRNGRSMGTDITPDLSELYPARGGTARGAGSQSTMAYGRSAGNSTNLIIKQN